MVCKLSTRIRRTKKVDKRRFKFLEKLFQNSMQKGTFYSKGNLTNSNKLNTFHDLAVDSALGRFIEPVKATCTSGLITQYDMTILNYSLCTSRKKKLHDCILLL